MGCCGWLPSCNRCCLVQILARIVTVEKDCSATIFLFSLLGCAAMPVVASLCSDRIVFFSSSAVFYPRHTAVS